MPGQHVSRRFLLASTATAVTATIAGCFGGGDDPENVIEEFTRRTDNGDVEGVNELIADDAPMDNWNHEDAAQMEVWDVELTHLETLEEDDDTASVEMTFRIDTGNQVVSETRVYELRKIDGEWLLWDSDGE